MAKTIDFGVFSYLTDTGKVRLSNQDQVMVVQNKVGDTLLIVADGIGGGNKGDYAAKLTVDHLVNEFKKHQNFISMAAAKVWLQYEVSRANKLVYDTSLTSPTYQGMGTTIVAVLIRRDKLVVINAGDSRAYQLLNNQLTMISEDQSYVEYLRRSGQISEEEKANHPNKNIIYNALGIYPTLSYQIKQLKYNGEIIMLCSDGLFNNVSEDKIKEILVKPINADTKVKTLINLANDNGGTDNISVAYYQRKKA